MATGSYRLNQAAYHQLQYPINYGLVAHLKSDNTGSAKFLTMVLENRELSTGDQLEIKCHLDQQLKLHRDTLESEGRHELLDLLERAHCACLSSLDETDTEKHTFN